MATYASTTFPTDDSAIGVDVDREQTERRQQTDGNQHEETAEQIGSATREIGLRGQGVNHQAQNNDARRGNALMRTLLSTKTQQLATKKDSNIVYSVTRRARGVRTQIA